MPYFFIPNFPLFCRLPVQVAASTNKEVDAHIPNYPNLPPQLICQLHNVTMHVSLDLFVTSALNIFVGCSFNCV